MGRCSPASEPRSETLTEGLCRVHDVEAARSLEEAARSLVESLVRFDTSLYQNRHQYPHFPAVDELDFEAGDDQITYSAKKGSFLVIWSRNIAKMGFTL